MRNLIRYLAGITAITGVTLFSGGCGTSSVEKPIRFYVGSSDTSLEYPIILCEYNPERALISVIDSFSGAMGPSYLAYSPGTELVYGIDKTVFSEDPVEMQVTAFTRDTVTGRLTFLNSQSSRGAGPCHVNCSKEGTWLFVANYDSGNLASFPIGEDGRIEPAVSVVQGEGTGPVTDRQGGPHTHFVTLDPAEHYLLSPDLGTDRVLICTFDQRTGMLEPNPAQPYFSLAPGSGPRHLVFHPEGKHIYVVNELNATITACDYDPENGTIRLLNTLSTVPEEHPGSKYPAAVRISPDGRYVYASTRGEVSCITVFRVESDGSLSLQQVVEEVPLWPRDFNIDPSGQYLIAAGERSHEIELFRIDANTGKLSRSGITCSLPSPGCILYLP